MPLLQGSVSIAAASVNDNLLTGSQFEFVPYDAIIEVGLCGDANGADLRIDAYSGQDILCEGLPASAQNRMPLYPDDFLLRDIAAQGERLKIRVRNTHATTARTINYAVMITPAEE